MRNMSFSLTKEQYLAGTKDVTRRLGWWFLEPGDQFRAVEKAMGLKKGEKVKLLGINEVVSVKKTILHNITQDDVVREGFPEMTVDDFVSMFCKHMGCHSWSLVNRIEFKVLELANQGGE